MGLCPVEFVVRKREPRGNIMNQTKRQSFIEAVFNTLIGFVVALISQIVVFPQFGIQVTFETNLWIGAWFTVISVVRSYIVRRWFNERLRKAAQAMAGRSI